MPSSIEPSLVPLQTAPISPVGAWSMECGQYQLKAGVPGFQIGRVPCLAAAQFSCAILFPRQGTSELAYREAEWAGLREPQAITRLHTRTHVCIQIRPFPARTQAGTYLPPVQMCRGICEPPRSAVNVVLERLYKRCAHARVLHHGTDKVGNLQSGRTQSSAILKEANDKLRNQSREVVVRAGSRRWWREVASKVAARW